VIKLGLVYILRDLFLYRRNNQSLSHLFESGKSP